MALGDQPSYIPKEENVLDTTKLIALGFRKCSNKKPVLFEIQLTNSKFLEF